jgi:hypothetical protein
LLRTRIAATEKRFIVRTDEKFTAFMEFEAAIAQLNRNQIVFLSHSLSD